MSSALMTFRLSSQVHLQDLPMCSVTRALDKIIWPALKHKELIKDDPLPDMFSSYLIMQPHPQSLSMLVPGKHSKSFL